MLEGFGKWASGRQALAGLWTDIVTTLICRILDALTEGDRVQADEDRPETQICLCQ